MVEALGRRWDRCCHHAVCFIRQQGTHPPARQHEKTKKSRTKPARFRERYRIHLFDRGIRPEPEDGGGDEGGVEGGGGARCEDGGGGMGGSSRISAVTPLAVKPSSSATAFTRAGALFFSANIYFSASRTARIGMPIVALVPACNSCLRLLVAFSRPDMMI